jgi:hypothetical protein
LCGPSLPAVENAISDIIVDLFQLVEEVSGKRLLHRALHALNNHPMLVLAQGSFRRMGDTPAFE